MGEIKTHLEFYLNGKKQIVRNSDPSQTVLEYVRSTGLTGTKLGCQEGGCGACTVTLGEWDPVNGKPYYYAINGCIVPIIALDGKHLTTVEGIGNSALPHAAQERIAKMHGSQCGFCTPGIVMSLYSLLRESKGNPTRQQLMEAFDGNLCRCTGYKPIIDAASTFVADEIEIGSNGEPVAAGESKTFNGTSANGTTSNGATSNGTSTNGTSTNGISSNGASANGASTNRTSSNGTSEVNGIPSNGAPPSEDAWALGNGGTGGCCGKAKDGQCCKSSGSSGPPGMRAYPHAELIFPPALRKYKPAILELQSGDGSTWYRPTSLSELTTLLRDHPKAKLVGGASEFQIEAKIRGDEHAVCIYVLDVPELRSFVHIEGEGVRIGANMPLSLLELELEKLTSTLDSSKTQFYEAILSQLKYFAGRQIRNVATPAGNIATASPISDLNPVFVSANAELEVLDPESGAIESLRMGEPDNPFFTGYRRTRLGNRLLLSIKVPETQEGDVVQTYKQAKRKDDDISIVTASLYARFAGDEIVQARLSYGGVAPFTVLAKSSQLLVNQKISSLKANLADYIEALDKEFNLPYSVPGGMAIFRRSLILSFFYKFAQQVLKQSGDAADENALLEVTRTEHPIGVRDMRNDYLEDIMGKNMPHVNAMKQVTGEALYVDDIPAVPSELYAVQVMSTKARAKIVSIDYDAALELEGVAGKIDITDVPGSNRWGKDAGPDRLFVENDNLVEYIGDCVAVIVAETRDIATKAARLVKIEYEDDPSGPIITIEDAIARDSYFDIKSHIERGNFDEVWKSAPYKFEGQCRMGAQEHFYLEPQGAVAIPEDAGHEFKIYASSQNPNETQLVAASALGMPASRIVARVKRLGGGFGGKETRSIHCSTLAVVAAKKFNKPVRIILSRSEDMVQAGQRHPFLTKWRVALDSNYKFIGLEARLYANAGYSMDLTKGVIDRAALHVDNCYDFGPNISVLARPCRTNIASNTAFRGFGGPQGMLVAESIIYEVSEKLGLSDPEELRRINYYPMDGTGRTHYLQRLGDDFTVPFMAKQLREKVQYDALRAEVDAFNAKSKWIKRGLACVPTKFGIAFGVQFLNQAGALVHIYEDGSILVAHGGTEMGQGLHTKMTMVAANELGVPVDNVFISETATNTVANASPTAASASSDLNGMAIKHACDQLNERLKPYREKLGPDATMHDIAHAAYFDRVNLSANGYYKMPDVGYFFDNSDMNPAPAFHYFTQGVATSMVEVDTLTGDWANLRTDIIMDIGRPINQAIDYGQIEGGFVQGQGLFTIEESLWNQQGGILTRGPGAYKIPGFRDIPQHFNVEHLQGREFKHLQTINRSKGIGEPPLFLGVTPMFAVRDALKNSRAENGQAEVQVVDAPLTTERIRIAVGDLISEKARVKIEGKAFSIRS